MFPGKLFLSFVASAVLLVAACRSNSEGVDPARSTGGAGGGGSGGRGGSAGRGGSGGTTGGSAGATGGTMAGGGAGGSASDGPREAAGDTGDTAKPDVTPDVMPDVRPPDAPPDLPPDPPRNLGQGAVCAANAECRSNFCVDGYCCNTACNNEPCMACSMAKTGMGNGTCGPNRPMVGMKCGRACQAVLDNRPAVVDKLCDAQGRCAVPLLPQNFEFCADEDPCTTLNCIQDTAKHTARCAMVGCGAGMCCCGGGSAARMCVRTEMCTGGGRACAP